MSQTDNLCERLRQLADDRGYDIMPTVRAALRQAAAEIERLREENARLRERMIDMMPIAGGNPMRPRNMRGGGLSSAPPSVGELYT